VLEVALSNGHLKVPDNIEEILKDVTAKTIKYHLEFINQFVVPESVDPYKIISWFGFFLDKHLNPTGEPHNDLKRLTLHTMLDRLNETLQKDIGQQLHVNTIQHLFELNCKDGRADDHFGIGMNGTYFAFHSVRDTVERRCATSNCSK